MSTWHISPTHGGQAYDIGADDGSNIALVYGPKDGGPADFLRVARLIAAAPDLLDAVLKLCDEFEDATYDTNSGGQSKHRKNLIVECRTIAKATQP